MKASAHLFDLIRSLSPSEKRHFRLYKSKHVIHGKNNYMKLFEAINKLESYDERKLKESLKGEAFVSNLAVEKNYLFEMIADSLHVYHLNASRESELRKSLHLIGIFFAKGLYPQCYKLVKQVRVAAEAMEKYILVHEALAWERRLMMQKSYAGTSPEKLEQVLSDTLFTAKRIENQSAYAVLSERVRFLIDTSGVVRSVEQKKKFDKIVDHPLLKHESEALSNAGKRMFNNIWMNYHFYTNGSTALIAKHTKRELYLLEANPEVISENPNLYVGVLGNSIITLLEQKNYPEAKSYLHKLRTFQENAKGRPDTNLAVRIFILLYSQELTLFIETGEFDQVNTVIDQIQQGLQRFEGKIGKTHAITIYYNLVYLFIGTGEYRKALQWLNKIGQYKDVDAREDIICFSKILQMLIYFELHDTEAIPYVFKSTYHYLSRRKRVYQGETRILNFIRKAPALETQHDLIAAYALLKKELSKLASMPFEKNMFGYFDFISWLESKIEKRNFAEIVRGKAQKKSGKQFSR